MIHISWLFGPYRIRPKCTVHNPDKRQCYCSNVVLCDFWWLPNWDSVYVSCLLSLSHYRPLMNFFFQCLQTIICVLRVEDRLLSETNWLKYRCPNCWVSPSVYVICHYYLQMEHSNCSPSGNMHLAMLLFSALCLSLSLSFSHISPAADLTMSVVWLNVQCVLHVPNAALQCHCHKSVTPTRGTHRFSPHH